MSSKEIKKSDETITISNKSGQDLKVCVEPWGDELEFPAGARFRIEADGPEGQSLEIEIATPQIVVWGWVGSRLTVFDGETFLRNYPIRVPPLS